MNISWCFILALSNCHRFIGGWYALEKSYILLKHIINLVLDSLFCVASIKKWMRASADVLTSGQPPKKWYSVRFYEWPKRTALTICTGRSVRTHIVYTTRESAEYMPVSNVYGTGHQLKTNREYPNRVGTRVGAQSEYILHYISLVVDG